jgi:hypothetical protein
LVEDSVFGDNGTATSLTSGVTIRESQRVAVRGSFFRNSSKFDLNALSCDDCSFTNNVAWHPRPSRTLALSAFRIVAGSAQVSQNVVDCDGAGGNAADLFGGGAKVDSRPGTGEVLIEGNVAFNAPTAFYLGRGPELSVGDNFAIGGELECGGRKIPALARANGSQLAFRGRLLSERHFVQAAFSPAVLTRQELAECVQAEGREARYRFADAAEPAVLSAVRQLFARELGRPASPSEEQKVAEFLAERTRSLGLAVARVKGSRDTGVRMAATESDGVLPIRCWNESAGQGGEQEVCAAQVGDDAFVEGDVRIEGFFAEQDLEKVRSQGVSARSARLWPGGVVPYVIDQGMPPALRTAVDAAIVHYNSKAGVTSVRLVPRYAQSSFLEFGVDSNMEWCGYASFRPHTQGWAVRLNARKLLGTKECLPALHVVVHEIGHTLGLSHEHQRSDRDNYLLMYPQNIKPSLIGALSKNTGADERFVGSYDFGSVMHYGSHGCSKNGLPVFVRRDNKQKITPPNSLSASDIAALRVLYTPPTPVPLPPGPFLAVTQTTAQDGSGPQISFEVDLRRNVTLYYRVIEVPRSTPSSELYKYFAFETSFETVTWAPQRGTLDIPDFTQGCRAVRAYSMWPTGERSDHKFIKICR